VKLLAADIGGTRIKLGLVELECDRITVCKTSVLDAASDRGLRRRLPAIAEELKQLDSDRNAAALGVCFASITVANRVTTSFGKFEDAPEVDLDAWSKEALELPLVLENDARAAAIGEWRYGAGRGCDDLVMITLGTGVGTCPIIGGVPLRGKHGQAGIMGGHLAIPEGRASCSCGSIGCGEVATATATLRDRVPGREDLTNYRSIFRQAAEGDIEARQLRDDALRGWGEIAVNLVHAYDPSRLILGGGVMGSRGLIVPAVQSWIDQHACTPWGRVEAHAAELGDAAGLLGVAWLASRKANNKEIA